MHNRNSRNPGKRRQRGEYLKKRWTRRGERKCGSTVSLKWTLLSHRTPRLARCCVNVFNPGTWETEDSLVYRASLRTVLVHRETLSEKQTNKQKKTKQTNNNQPTKTKTKTRKPNKNSQTPSLKGSPPPPVASQGSNTWNFGDTSQTTACVLWIK